MDALWTLKSASVREIQEALPAADRPAYTTVQTIVSRLEAKKAVRRVKKVGNAYIFEPTISRTTAQRRLIDELLSFFGGRTQPVVAHLIEAGELAGEERAEAERALKKTARKDRPSRRSPTSPTMSGSRRCSRRPSEPRRWRFAGVTRQCATRCGSAHR